MVWTPHSSLTISNLDHAAQFLPQAADRIHHAWWRASDLGPADIADRLMTLTRSGAPHCTLIAHDGENFLGTASIIPSDLEARPQWTPWVAAVWVEPHHRGQGIATRLIEEASRRAFQAGVPRLYLCAHVGMEAFYLGLGWRIIDRAVGPDSLTVFDRVAPLG